MLQHEIAEPGSAKHAAGRRVLGGLNIVKAHGEKWSLGHVLGAVLKRFFTWSDNGKRMWRREDDTEQLEWQPPATGSDGRIRSARPAAARR